MRCDFSRVLGFVKGQALERPCLSQTFEPPHHYKQSIQEQMAITVGPTYNQATGEYGEQQVSISMHHGSNIPVGMEEQSDDAFAPINDRETYTSDPAFGPNATAADINAFWQGTRPLTSDEISMVQDQITELGFDSDEGRRLGRFLSYRVTGNTEDLFDDDMLALNIQPPDPDAWTPQDTDEYVLAELPERTETLRPDIAEYLGKRPLGNSPAAITVQHFASQYLLGRISNQEAFAGAMQSGVPQEQLYEAFAALTDLFE